MKTKAIGVLAMLLLWVCSAPAIANTIVYSGMTGPYLAFPTGPGNLGVDDYDTGLASPTFLLASFSFVGGVDFAAGANPIDRALQFRFLDENSALVNSVNVAFPDSGRFIWTITLPSPLLVASRGQLQVLTLGSSVGQWFLTSTAPSVGSNSSTSGGADGGALRHAFELTRFDPLAPVPEPGSLALFSLGLAGLGLSRRRRA